MGVHVGTPRMIKDPKTRRVEYIGPVVNAAARITAITNGGQVIISSEAMKKLQDTELGSESDRFVNLGNFEMTDNPRGEISCPLFVVHVRACVFYFYCL
jgi:class 3 adenylate cyclase